ncbi:MAG TPA: molybdopterin cofactor-binding domain-containing protein, partial [Thermomicrobiaceae bacterium]|nr:molybdopterin cofactor-binding domain-containing protein [Thermomicrobiaceae bacterium]
MTEAETVEDRGPERPRLVGTSVRRIEDERLITGAGAYLEDLRIPGMADVALVRSPHAHATIRAMRLEAARAAPGVIAVVTGEDLRDVGDVPVGGNLKIPEHPPLTRGTVKFVGDPVVAVIAETRVLAEDAAGLVEVDYDPLPAVVDPREALADDAPRVHAQFDSNVVFSAEMDTGGVDEAFAAAEHRLAVHVGHARVAALPMETRGGIGAFDAESGQYTLWLGTQAAWIERTDLAKALGVPEEQVRVITPDVGGAFGGKMTAYREDIL